MFMHYFGGGIGHLGQVSSRIHWGKLQEPPNSPDDDDDADVTTHGISLDLENTGAEGDVMVTEGLGLLDSDEELDEIDGIPQEWEESDSNF
jgi:hypothetical protein